MTHTHKGKNSSSNPHCYADPDEYASSSHGPRTPREDAPALFKRPLSDVRRKINQARDDGQNLARDDVSWREYGSFAPNSSGGSRQLASLARSFSPDRWLTSGQRSRGSLSTAGGGHMPKDSLTSFSGGSLAGSAYGAPKELDVNVSMVLNEGQRRYRL